MSWRLAHGSIQSTAETRIGRSSKRPFHVGLMHGTNIRPRAASGLSVRLGDTTYWFTII